MVVKITTTSGLALARGLIELHAGTIRAASAGLGQGTEVIVRLPGSCIVSEQAGGPELLLASPVSAKTDSIRCILIADDNVDAADSLAELLRLEGYEVHVAYDGAEALATVARVEPDGRCSMWECRMCPASRWFAPFGSNLRGSARR